MKRNVIVLIIGLAILLAFQAKVVMPLIQDVASSGLFLKDSGDEPNRSSSDNLMTNAAFDQCNNYIASELLEGQTVNFPEKAINAFSLGSFRYVVNADIEIQPTDAASVQKRYVCRVEYSNGNDTSGLTDAENWSIDGLSGLDDNNVL